MYALLYFIIARHTWVFFYVTGNYFVMFQCHKKIFGSGLQAGQ